MNSATNKLKILNDPVHGFIRIPFEFIYDLVEDPWFQRLRYIRQLGLTDMVYPGATHSRFSHSLGAMHLMNQALTTLRYKNVEISDSEFEAALVAILCHDIGHGPLSHSLEFNIYGDVSHEKVSLAIMELLNEKYGGKLDMAIDMFTGNYPRLFFNELISSQMDMDRLDYLLRDSYYTGVIEGSVGSERIIGMLNTAGGRLVVEEKGIYSIEKFLIARRFMYWQVYMHKTVLAADQLIRRITERARLLIENGEKVLSAEAVDYFLRKRTGSDQPVKDFAGVLFGLDDNELITSVRMWSGNKDRVLSDLSDAFIKRRLPAIELSDSEIAASRQEELTEKLNILNDYRSQDPGSYVYSGSISNMTYAPSSPSIRILGKDGSLRDLSQVSGILKHETLSQITRKYFVCFPKDLRSAYSL